MLLMLKIVRSIPSPLAHSPVNIQPLVGLSKTVTAPDESSSSDSSPPDVPEITLQKTVTLGRPSSPHDTPFTMEELEKAMSRATMRPRRATAVDTALPMATVTA